MNIYKELYEYLKSADVEAQNRAFNTPDYVFDLSYEEFVVEKNIQGRMVHGLGYIHLKL